MVGEVTPEGEPGVICKVPICGSVQKRLLSFSSLYQIVPIISMHRLKIRLCSLAKALSGRWVPLATTASPFPSHPTHCMQCLKIFCIQVDTQPQYLLEFFSLRNWFFSFKCLKRNGSQRRQESSPLIPDQACGTYIVTPGQHGRNILVVDNYVVLCSISTYYWSALKIHLVEDRIHLAVPHGRYKELVWYCKGC